MVGLKPQEELETEENPNIETRISKQIRKRDKGRPKTKKCDRGKLGTRGAGEIRKRQFLRKPSTRTAVYCSGLERRPDLSFEKNWKVSSPSTSLVQTKFVPLPW